LDPAQVVINFVARQLCVAVVGDTAQQAQGCTDKAWHSGCAQWLHLNQARSDTMNKDQVVGKIKDLAGEAQAGVGKAINSPSQIAKGKALEAEGEIQKKAGDVKETLKDAADAAKKRL